jgi:hypothetical protein
MGLLMKKKNNGGDVYGDGVDSEILREECFSFCFFDFFFPLSPF